MQDKVLIILFVILWLVVMLGAFYAMLANESELSRQEEQEKTIAYRGYIVNQTTKGEVIIRKIGNGKVVFHAGYETQLTYEQMQNLVDDLIARENGTFETTYTDSGEA